MIHLQRNKNSPEAKNILYLLIDAAHLCHSRHQLQEAFPPMQGRSEEGMLHKMVFATCGFYSKASLGCKLLHENTVYKYIIIVYSIIYIYIYTPPLRTIRTFYLIRSVFKNMVNCYSPSYYTYTELCLCNYGLPLWK